MPLIQYSEVMIMTSEHASIGRLILEPFSRVLYSTKPEEYERVKRYEGDKMTCLLLKQPIGAISRAIVNVNENCTTCANENCTTYK